MYSLHSPKSCVMLEGLKWAKIPISKSRKYVFLKVCAIAYSRGGRHFFDHMDKTSFNHMDIINVWIISFHKMGQKWAQIPACYLYPKTKVLYMKVIISYELKLSHTSSPYSACQLKHQVLTLNNRPIMSCIFQMYVKCHFTEWAQNKPKFQCAACTKKVEYKPMCCACGYSTNRWMELNSSKQQAKNALLKNGPFQW